MPRQKVNKSEKPIEKEQGVFKNFRNKITPAITAALLTIGVASCDGNIPNNEFKFESKDQSGKFNIEYIAWWNLMNLDVIIKKQNDSTYNVKIKRPGKNLDTNVSSLDSIKGVLYEELVDKYARVLYWETQENAKAKINTFVDEYKNFLENPSNENNDEKSTTIKVKYNPKK